MGAVPYGKHPPGSLTAALFCIQVHTLRPWDLFCCDAVAGHAPEGPGDGGRVVEVEVGEGRLEGVGRLPGIVVGHGGAHVVKDVRGTDPVVEQVEDGAVGAVDGLEGALDPGVLVLVKVGNVDI